MVRAAALLFTLLTAAGANATMTIEKETRPGWPNTYRLSNGLVEARVLTDVGPRIIDVRPAGGENVFYVRPAEAGKSGEKEWVFRGGWRLWISPERRETTYALDNEPCKAEVIDGRALRVTGPPQPEAGIQKIVEVILAEDQPIVEVKARIRNISDEPVTYAAWSLAVMRPGGRAFVPLDVGPPTSFDAIRRLILWSYTRMDDPRYVFGDRLVQIDQSKVPAAPAVEGRRADESKIATDSKQGWAAYLNGDVLFTKRWKNEDGERTDGGATTEIYSSHEFLELEHLGPLRTIAPGEEIRLDETWSIRTGVDEAGALKTLGAN